MKNDPKSGGLTPVRRVVTGNDARGHSKVVWDGPASNAHEASMGTGRGHTDLWVWTDSPAPLSGDYDDGKLEYAFAGPPEGGHLRVVEARMRPANYDPAKDKSAVPAHPPKPRPGARGTWDRGGNNAYSSAMHKTETVDYGIVLADDGHWLFQEDVGGVKLERNTPEHGRLATSAIASIQPSSRRR